jgi:hypothetical protein
LEAVVLSAGCLVSRRFLSGDGAPRGFFVKRSTSPSSAVCGRGEFLVPRPDPCRWRIRCLKLKTMVISRCSASAAAIPGVGSMDPVLGDFPAAMGLAPIQGEEGAAAAARHRQLLGVGVDGIQKDFSVILPLFLDLSVRTEY